MRLIKQYPNRKLYDTGSGNYINYSDLFRLIQDGLEIRVVRNRDKLDVTDSYKARLAARALSARPELWLNLIKEYQGYVMAHPSNV